MQHMIHVDFDPQTERLAINKGDITLGHARDVVAWSFRGLREGHQPTIIFEDGNALGPFASIDQLPRVVLGMGNTGDAGSLQRSYRAALIQSGAPIIESTDSATVTNQVAERYSPLIIHVAPDPRDPMMLIVDPQEAEIFSGQSVLWRFRDVPLNVYRPRIEFTSVPPPISRRGPFASLTISQPDPGSEGYTAQIAGATVDRRGSSYYQIWAVSIDGSGVLRTHPERDPQIDDMGPPPGGGGEPPSV